MSLFSRMVTAASLWVHLLAINLVSARSILRDGEYMGNNIRPLPCTTSAVTSRVGCIQGGMELGAWLAHTPGGLCLSP